MGHSERSRLAVAMFAFTVIACLVSFPGYVAASDIPNENVWGFRSFGTVGALVFAVGGLLLASKRPENPIGWLFGAMGSIFGVNSLGEAYAVYPMLAGERGPILYRVAWATSWVWVFGFAMVAFAVLLYPTGHLPSPRWKPAARFMAVGFALGAVTFAVAPGPLNNMPADIVNRYAIPEGAFASIAVPIGMLCFVGSLALACVAVVVRYRASTGLQRQQMKMFALAAAFLAVTMPAVAIPWESRLLANTLEMAASIAVLSLPVAMTVAVLRYRLYEIDVVINRALVYATLTGVLALSYLGIVVLLQAALAPITRQSDLAVAGSTLAVAALFRPLRARVQTFIDKRFYRSRYDAAETLSDFSGRLRNEVDLEALGRELVGVVGETMEPAHATLWLRPSRQEQP